MNRLLHHQHKKMITHVQHTKYCTRKNRIKSKSRFFFKIESKLIVWLKSHIVTALHWRTEKLIKTGSMHYFVPSTSVA